MAADGISGDAQPADWSDNSGAIAARQGTLRGVAMPALPLNDIAGSFLCIQQRTASASARSEQDKDGTGM